MLFEEPSIRGLIVMPIFGSLFDGYCMRVRDDVRKRDVTRGYWTTRGKLLLVLTEIRSTQVDRLLGRGKRLHVRRPVPIPGQSSDAYRRTLIES